MRVLLFGTGAVGIALAVALRESGQEVDLIARAETKKAITEKGIGLRGLFGEKTIAPESFKVYAKIEEIGEQDLYDYILVASKATALREAAEDLASARGILKKDGKIVLFQNGMGTEESFLEYFSPDTVFQARIITGFSRPEPNISLVTVHVSPILIGNLKGYSAEPLQELAAAINKGGVPCEITGDLASALWAKMLYNCALNPLGAILGVSYGKLTENEYSLGIMNRVIEEIYEVMKASGQSTYWPDAESYKKVLYEELIPPTYNHRSSTLQDIEKKTKTEIDTLNGYIVRTGRRLGVDVSYNEMLYSLIRSMESYH